MTVTSDTDICNLAQDLLGGAVVGNITDPSTPIEDLLARWYDHSRKKVLRAHPWKFATKRALLAASSTAPVFGYTKAFPVPNDFIRFLTIETDEGVHIPSTNYEFEGNSILTDGDTTSLRLRYVYNVEDVSQFDPMFINYLAHEIALATAYKITESNGSVQRIAELEKAIASMSKAIDSQEKPPLRIRRSENRSARRSSSSRISHRIQF
jgi:hypothetical protein